MHGLYGFNVPVYTAMCVKIYALKPFEADIGSVSPATE